LTKLEAIRLLSERLKTLAEHLPITRVVLFGSYARGNYTVGSDIDLLVVYRGERREDAYALVKKVLNLPGLEPHVYTEAECETVHGTIQTMLRDSVVLFPADDSSG